MEKGRDWSPSVPHLFIRSIRRRCQLGSVGDHVVVDGSMHVEDVPVTLLQP